MSRKGLVQPLALAAILALGFAVVWGVLGLWLAQLGEYAVEGKRERENLFFRPDGTALVEHGRAGPSKHRHYTDLEGKAVQSPDDADIDGLLITHLPAKLPLRSIWGDASWEQRILSIPDGRPQPVLWHFVSDGRSDGTAYFVGYDTESRTCAGYLGTSGFREIPLPPEEFIPFGGIASLSRSQSRVIFQGVPANRRRDGMARAPRGFVSPWDVYVLSSKGTLYHADLQSRRVQVIRENAPIRSATLLASISDAVHGTLRRLAVRTDDTLVVMDEGGEVLRRYPIPEPAREHELYVAEASGGEAVMYWKDKRERSPAKVDHRICWVSPNGRYRETQVALTSDELVLSSPQTATVLPSPLLLGGFLACFLAPAELERERAATYSQAVGQQVMQSWPALALAQLLSALLALFCYRRQVRYGASRTERIAWTLFVLLLGLPGWIGYRFGRRWPVLETCPVCGAIVPRDRSECARCASEFPLPELKGTEVFA